MGRLLRFELIKMTRRPRTYLGTATFILITLAVMLGVKYGGVGQMIEHAAARQGFDGFFNPANAEFLCWLVVASPVVAAPLLTMFMPFFVCLVFGEIFAGECGEGTLRAALTRPVTRAAYFGGKLAACLIYVLALVFSLGVVAYLIGFFAFGHGGLLTLTWQPGMPPAIGWFDEGAGLARLALCYLLTAAGMLSIGMFAFFIGVWLNNALGATGASIMLLFSMFIIGEIEWFTPIKPYLFTTHLTLGQKMFLTPIPWKAVTGSLEVLGVYIVVLSAASLLIFLRKDILA